LFSERIRMHYYKHETAEVEEGATIGDNTKIWRWTHIRSGAIIGEDCVLGQNVYVAEKAIIGNNVHIQNNVSIYNLITLEDDVFIGPSVVFTNDKRPRVGIVNQIPTLIKQGASLCANTTVVCGIIVGRYALVGAGSVVTKNVLDYALVYGDPARLAGWVCKCGADIDFANRIWPCITTCKVCGRQFNKEEKIIACEEG